MNGDAPSAADRPPDAATVADWEDPPRSAATGAAPVLSVAGFEGPLDWLLEMARARNRSGPAADRRADPVLCRRMAATLTDLRSRLLLPTEAPEARQALSEADALRRQLLARAEMRVAADWLERQHQVGRDVFVRGRPEMGTAQRSTGITDLLRACLTLLRVPADLAAIYRPRPPPFCKCRTQSLASEDCSVDYPMAVASQLFCPRSTSWHRTASCAAVPRSPAPCWPGWNWRGRAISHSISQNRGRRLQCYRSMA